jgi:hypothetical protein
MCHMAGVCGLGVRVCAQGIVRLLSQLSHGNAMYVTPRCKQKDERERAAGRRA